MKRGVRLSTDGVARGRSASTLPGEIRVRGGQAIASLGERVGLAMAGVFPRGTRAPSGVRRELRGNLTRIAGTAREHLAHGVLPGLRDVSLTVATLRRACPDAESSTRCRADQSADGVFDLLGHQRVSFGSPIDWHLDPSSGLRAPRRHWSRIAYLDPSVVGDYKLLWELNRHQHFVTLGQAYAYSRDVRYANAFVAQLTDWIEANPPRVGINWASSLEVSYRAISWLWALQLFADAPQLTDDVLAVALESLRRHATHISRYLSTYYSPNTHLTGEALGLLYLGTALPLFQDAQHWRAEGWNILREQLFRQVRADGTYFEQALYYHRYTADIYQHALMLADANGWARDAAVWERTERLLECLIHVVHPDGTVPLVGDDDGGRVMRLDALATRDARPTLATGAALFGRSDMRSVAGDAVEECLWLLGETGAAALASRPPATPSGGSRAFRDGGFYVMRDGWDSTSTWALIDAGPHGSLNCGHAHADALSLEVATGGSTVLADAGTFSYTGVERTAFRATSVHNTVTVDGESSSVVGGLFHWRHVARTTTSEWTATPSFDYWSGSQDGYARLVDPALHERHVLFLHDRYFVVLDALDAAGAHEWTAHWHAAPGLALQRGGESDVQLVNPARGDLTLLKLLVIGDGTLVAGSTWRSEAYGSRKEAPSVAYTTSGAGRQTAVTLLVPGAARARSVSANDSGAGIEVVGSQFHDTVVRRGRATSLELLGLTTDAECAVFTRGIGGIAERAFLLGATYAVGSGLERQPIAPGALFVARLDLGQWKVESGRSRPSVQV
ncbi:MAG: putative Heparinase family protein [Gemmatimonadetes bacterium]|nr:putative Heparinase family protein [Gemmatimonadota bacterium]